MYIYTILYTYIYILYSDWENLHQLASLDIIGGQYRGDIVMFRGGVSSIGYPSRIAMHRPIGVVFPVWLAIYNFCYIYIYILAIYNFWFVLMKEVIEIEGTLCGTFSC